MHPDTVPAAPLSAIPFIRVANGIGSAPVEVRELAARQPFTGEVQTDGGPLVAFFKFINAVFPDGYVIVGGVARNALLILEDVHRGGGGLHHNGMTVGGRHLEQIARHAIARGFQVVADQSGARLLAQRGNFFRQRAPRVTQSLDGAGSREQQVASHQLGQAEVRSLA